MGCLTRCPHCIRPLFRCRFEEPIHGVIGMRSFSKGIAWLCLLLTFLSAVELVTHRHSSQEQSAACRVCVAAHSTVPAIAPLPPKTEFARILALRPQPTAAKQRLISFALLVRPPPSV
ncbi:hypothetical protein SBA7_570020 [Candidatus Sulfotelmatobacter sp. SbA7]|nr:hypothetical protein SBA7_570020 [Candidatus Sulfotelmatobacter sp. SbA7]